MLQRLRSSVMRQVQGVKFARAFLPACTQTRLFHSRTFLRSETLLQYQPTAEDPETGFDFTVDNYHKIETILKKYPDNYKESAVIPLLYLVQEQCGNWVPLAGMNRIAKVLDISPIRVYEVVTFYTMFNRKPVGKYHLQVCGTTPCMLCDSEGILDTIQKECDIKIGETSKDGLFTLQEVECLGACVNAPMMQINNKHYYENLTPKDVKDILSTLREGKEPKVGPYNGQKTCEGPMGRTTLKDPASIDPTIHFRDPEGLKKE